MMDIFALYSLDRAQEELFARVGQIIQMVLDKGVIWMHLAMAHNESICISYERFVVLDRAL